MGVLRPLFSEYAYSKKDKEFYYIGSAVEGDDVLTDIAPFKRLTVPEVLRCLRREKKNVEEKA